MAEERSHNDAVKSHIKKLFEQRMMAADFLHFVRYKSSRQLPDTNPTDKGCEPMIGYYERENSPFSAVSSLENGSVAEERFSSSKSISQSERFIHHRKRQSLPRNKKCHESDGQQLLDISRGSDQKLSSAPLKVNRQCLKLVDCGSDAKYGVLKDRRPKTKCQSNKSDISQVPRASEGKTFPVGKRQICVPESVSQPKSIEKVNKLKDVDCASLNNTKISPIDDTIISGHLESQKSEFSVLNVSKSRSSESLTGCISSKSRSSESLTGCISGCISSKSRSSESLTGCISSKSRSSESLTGCISSKSRSSESLTGCISYDSCEQSKDIYTTYRNNIEHPSSKVCNYNSKEKRNFSKSGKSRPYKINDKTYIKRFNGSLERGNFGVSRLDSSHNVQNESSFMSAKVRSQNQTDKKVNTWDSRNLKSSKTEHNNNESNSKCSSKVSPPRQRQNNWIASQIKDCKKEISARSNRQLLLPHADRSTPAENSSLYDSGLGNSGHAKQENNNCDKRSSSMETFSLNRGYHSMGSESYRYPYKELSLFHFNMDPLANSKLDKGFCLFDVLPDSKQSLQTNLALNATYKIPQSEYTHPYNAHVGDMPFTDEEQRLFKETMDMIETNKQKEDTKENDGFNRNDPVLISLRLSKRDSTKISSDLLYKKQQETVAPSSRHILTQRNGDIWKQNADYATEEIQNSSAEACEISTSLSIPSDSQVFPPSHMPNKLSHKALKPVSKALHPVPKALHPVHKESQLFSKASNPIHKASHPGLKASNPIHKASHPVPKASNPIHKALHPGLKASNPIHKASHPVPKALHTVHKESHLFSKASNSIHKEMHSVPKVSHPIHKPSHTIPVTSHHDHMPLQPVPKALHKVHQRPNTGLKASLPVHQPPIHVQMASERICRTKFVDKALQPSQESEKSHPVHKASHPFPMDPVPECKHNEDPPKKTFFNVSGFDEKKSGLNKSVSDTACAILDWIMGHSFDSQNTSNHGGSANPSSPVEPVYNVYDKSHEGLSVIDEDKYGTISHILDADTNKSLNNYHVSSDKPSVKSGTFIVKNVKRNASISTYDSGSASGSSLLNVTTASNGSKSFRERSKYRGTSCFIKNVEKNINVQDTNSNCSLTHNDKTDIHSKVTDLQNDNAQNNAMSKLHCKTNFDESLMMSKHLTGNHSVCNNNLASDTSPICDTNGLSMNRCLPSKESNSTNSDHETGDSDCSNASGFCYRTKVNKKNATSEHHCQGLEQRKRKFSRKSRTSSLTVNEGKENRKKQGVRKKLSSTASRKRKSSDETEVVLKQSKRKQCNKDKGDIGLEDQNYHLCNLSNLEEIVSGMNLKDLDKLIPSPHLLTPHLPNQQNDALSALDQAAAVFVLPRHVGGVWKSIITEVTVNNVS